jgi:hypothetical protein
MAGWVGGGRLVVLLLLVTQLLGQLAAETPGSPTSLRLYNPTAANPIIRALWDRYVAFIFVFVYSRLMKRCKSNQHSCALRISLAFTAVFF